MSRVATVSPVDRCRRAWPAGERGADQDRGPGGGEDRRAGGPGGAARRSRPHACTDAHATVTVPRRERPRGSFGEARVRVAVELGYPSDIGAQCGAVRRQVAERVRRWRAWRCPTSRWRSSGCTPRCWKRTGAGGCDERRRTEPPDTRRLPTLDKTPDATGRDDAGRRPDTAATSTADDDRAGRFWSARRVPAARRRAAAAGRRGPAALRRGRGARRPPRDGLAPPARRRTGHPHLDDPWVLGAAAVAVVLGLWLIVLAVTPGLRAAAADAAAMAAGRPGRAGPLGRRAGAARPRHGGRRACSPCGVKVSRRKAKAHAVSHFRELDEVRADLDAALGEGLRQLGPGPAARPVRPRPAPEEEVSERCAGSAERQPGAARPDRCGAARHRRPGAVRRPRPARGTGTSRCPPAGPGPAPTTCCSPTRTAPAGADEGWWWPVVIAVLAVCVLLLLWWLLAQLRRRRLDEILVDSGDGEGALLRGRALEDVLAAEAEALHGVDRAGVLLTGRRTATAGRGPCWRWPRTPTRAPSSGGCRTRRWTTPAARPGSTALPAEVRLRAVKHRAERVSCELARACPPRSGRQDPARPPAAAGSAVRSRAGPRRPPAPSRR